MSTKNKQVCCMRTRVTDFDDLQDALGDLREVIEEELEQGPLQIHLDVEMAQ